MTWVDLPDMRPRTNGNRPPCAVLASCNAAGVRFRQHLRITIRPDLLEGGCVWWVAGAFVHAQIGRDTHLGQLRLSPVGKNAGLKLSRPIGTSKSPSLSLIGFPHLVSGVAHRGEALEHDHGDDWIELTLPSWASPPPKPAIVTKPAYVGITQRVADPGVALQPLRGSAVR